jgi:NADP-dependent 3-hydroxy acid dehydrogenase YdfG
MPFSDIKILFVTDYIIRVIYAMLGGLPATFIVMYLKKKYGHELLLVARNHENLKIAANKIKELNPNIVPTSIAAIDVSDYDKVKENIENFIKKAGHIDLLCNNAGYVKRGSSDLSHNEFLKMFNTNLIGVFNLIHTVSPFMK